MEAKQIDVFLTMSKESLQTWELVFQDLLGMPKINAQFMELLVQPP